MDTNTKDGFGEIGTQFPPKITSGMFEGSNTLHCSWISVAARHTHILEEVANNVLQKGFNSSQASVRGEFLLST